MTVLADRYELGRLLGAGGMARVVEAYDRLLDRKVAIKLLHEGIAPGGVERERLLREARAAASFSHPGAVAVYDVGSTEHSPYIVMELVEGRTLADALRGGPLPVEQAVDVAARSLEALAAAHAAGLVHRDVKPANILLPESGGVKLADFGIAKGLREVTGGLTGTGQLIGTPRYLSPEQVAGEPADERSDVYAMGVVLYELLTGRAPFDAPTPLATALAHQNTQPLPLEEAAPQVDAHLAAVVHRALAKDPDRRFRDASEMRAALLGEAPATMPPAPGGEADRVAGATTKAVERPAPRGRGREGVMPVVLAALVLLVLAGYLVSRSDGGPEAGSPEAPTADERDEDPADPPPDATEPPPADDPPDEEPATDPPADEEPVDEEAPEEEPADEPAEGQGGVDLGALIGALAQNPAQAGEKGEDLFELLVDVSRESPQDRPAEARAGIEEIQNWIANDELDPRIGAAAIELLEPLAADG